MTTYTYCFYPPVHELYARIFDVHILKTDNIGDAWYWQCLRDGIIIAQFPLSWAMVQESKLN